MYDGKKKKIFMLVTPNNFEREKSDKNFRSIKTQCTKTDAHIFWQIFFPSNNKLRHCHKQKSPL
jgi:hypothetical protein